MKKKEILLTIALAIFVLGLALGIGTLNATKEKLPDALDYSQLQLAVQYGAAREHIKVWQNAEGTYYFFLPANVSLKDTRFANLGKDALFWLNGSPYQDSDAYMGTIQCGQMYTMQLQIAGNMLNTANICFIQSENLPALFIDTESGSIDNIHADKNVREAAALFLYDENGNRIYGGDIEYIKCRGYSSFESMDKKSYMFRLLKKEPLLKMEKAEKWILLANAKDGTFLRNKLVFDFADNHSDVEGIEGRYVDLYLNGEYVGNYYLCERIEVSSNRINIQNLDELNKAVNSSDTIENGVQYLSEDGTFRAIEGLINPPDITGGYLLEHVASSDYDICPSGFTTSMGIQFEIRSPKAASPEEVAYIQSFFNEFEAALQQEDGINPDTGKHISEYMDLKVWAQKFLIEDGFQNPDAGSASSYFYKDCDSKDPLIKAGPVWDYDRALGAYLSNSFTSLDDPGRNTFYYLYSEEMLKHEEVREIIAELLESWYAPYMEQHLAAYVAHWQEYLRGSAYMDAIRWPDRADFYSSYDANYEYLLKFVQTRTAFLKSLFLEETAYHTVTFWQNNAAESYVYTIPHGGYMTEPAPVITSYEGIFSGWVNKKTGTRYDARLPILEDTVYEAEWLPVDLLVLNGLGMAEINLQDVDVDALQAFVDMIREMQEEERDSK